MLIMRELLHEPNACFEPRAPESQRHHPPHTTMKLALAYTYYFLVWSRYDDMYPVASFAKEANPRLAKRPLIFDGCLANCGLTSLINSLWPSDAIWRQGPRSTLAQVMACCLTAPSHYLNQADASIPRSSGIHQMALSQWIPQPWIV